MIAAIISKGLGIVENITGWNLERFKAKNAPDVRAAEIGKQETAEQNKDEQDVSKRDIDKAREGWSE